MIVVRLAPKPIFLLSVAILINDETLNAIFHIMKLASLNFLYDIPVNTKIILQNNFTTLWEIKKRTRETFIMSVQLDITDSRIPKL